jgi:cAMP phosphodiesterase
MDKIVGHLLARYLVNCLDAKMNRMSKKRKRDDGQLCVDTEVGQKGAQRKHAELSLLENFMHQTRGTTTRETYFVAIL